MIPGELRVSVCQWLSKSGCLTAHESELRILAPRLARDEIAEFYCFLRDNSQRWESEWRPEFRAIFSVPDDTLPEANDPDRWSSILHGLVARGDLEKVRSFIIGIGLPQWDFKPNEAEPDRDIYPIDDPDEHGETPAKKARRLGFADVANYLTEAKELVRGRYRARWKADFDKQG